MDEIWSDIIPTAVKLPFSVYKNRFTIQYWWKKLYVELNKGNTNIVIVGRPSTGKSILCSHFNGKVNIKYKLPETSDERESDVVKFKNWAKIVRVIPGQSSKEREKSLEEAFDKHTSLEGVIYVVDWGYNRERSKIIRDKLINEDNINSFDALRKYNLQLELNDFKHVVSKLKQSKSNGRGPKWVVIAVNKVDLYFEKINEAQKYYHPSFRSEFTDILNEFIRFVGEQNIKCISLPICCWETNLEWNGEIIRTNINGRENGQFLFANFYSALTKLSN